MAEAGRLARLWDDLAVRLGGKRVPATAFDRTSAAIEEEFARYKVFMIVGPARSGTTATIHTLGLARNVETFSEPLPRLGVEVRRHQLGFVDDPVPVIWRSRIDRIRKVTGKGKIYGEKDQQIYCWLPYYRRLFNPRIVLVRRDGRDSVRSLYNQHYEVLGNLYREVADNDYLSPQARSNTVTFPAIEHDPVDLMRQRPTAEDPVFFEWARMSRFEMIAWYWSAYVRSVQRDLYNMENDRWRVLNFATQNTGDDFERLYEFLGLEGFDRSTVESKLSSRPGALAQQLERQSMRLPHWREWPEETVQAFDRYAAAAMVQCGYYGIDRLPICEGARPGGEQVVRFVNDPLMERVVTSVADDILPQLPPCDSVLVLGATIPSHVCGRVTFWEGGKLADLPVDEHDLVLAVGVIDQSPDMDALLIELAKRTRRYLIVTARWGHFDQLIEHQYRWGVGSYGEHRWSIAKARSLLHHALGFGSVDSTGLETKDHLRPRVSVLIGSRQEFMRPPFPSRQPRPTL